MAGTQREGGRELRRGRPAIAREKSLNKPVGVGTNLARETASGDESARCFGGVAIDPSKLVVATS